MKNLFVKRIVIGKTLGFAIGLLAFILMPFFLPDASLMFRFGVLLWYTILGAIIGVFGVMDYHPVLRFRINAWFRGIVIGGSMNLALVLIAFGEFEALTSISAGGFAAVSPFWGVLEGAVIGVIIDLIATKYAGEGTRIVVSETGQVTSESKKQSEVQ